MPPRASSSKLPAAANVPLPLNAFLQHLCAQGLSMQNAIKVAGPMLKAGLNTPAKITGLNEAALTHLDIVDVDVRKQLLSIGKKGKKSLKGNTESSPTNPKKRRRDADLDQGLPDQAQPAKKIALDINEEVDEFSLETKSVIVNRAPVMTAWSFVVAERLSFNREEALSLAQAYTEANAISKGVSLGILSSPDKPSDAGSAQPFIELMGRKVPMISLQDGQWRGMVKGAMADPERAFSYMQRNFRQQIGSVIGAMRLLAESFPPAELNEKGYGLYIEFRPQGNGWGEKSELKLESILSLRRHLTHKDTKSRVKFEDEAKPEFIFNDMPIVKKELNDNMLPVKTEPKESEGLPQTPEDEFDKYYDEDIDFSKLDA